MKQLREFDSSIQFHLPLLKLQSAALAPEEQRELIQALAELLLQAASRRVRSLSEGDEREPEDNG
jgi:hypothetical protein